MADRSEAPVDTIVGTPVDPVKGEPEAKTETAAEVEPAEAAPEAALEAVEEDSGAETEAEAEAGPDATPASATATATAEQALPVAVVPVLAPAPPRRSGDRIANRYRLEECLTQGGVFTSWRAVDEKLRRAVGIHLLAAGHQRSQAAVAAARQAALLSDPRFVQVLDAVEEGELVYIIREWLPDATDLGTLLAEEPLEPYEAYQMVRQVTDAIAAAHRKGLSHLRLTPACVLRSDGGQYRINGIVLDAALHGLEPEDRAVAELADTRALGSLLFAALTQRWPDPEGRHGLQGLPRGIGIVPPEQIRAGIHRGLSDLCARILCATPPRHLEPLTSPQALAKAIDLMPKVRQPDPEPLVLPEYPTRNYPPGSPSGRPPAPPQRPAAAPQAPPPALPGRTGTALKWAISLVVLAAVGLGSWGTAAALMDKPGPSTPGSSAPAGISPKTPAPQQSTLHQLTITGASEFSPRTDPIAAKEVPLAWDRIPTTAWMTSLYRDTPNFGNLPARADGSGIVVDLGSVQNVSGVTLLLPTAGETLEVLAAPADASAAPTNGSAEYTQRLSNSAVVGTSFTSAPLATPVRTRFVLIHLTSLPPDSAQGNAFRGGISEIQILG